MFPNKKRRRDADFYRDLDDDFKPTSVSDPFGIGLDDSDSFFLLHQGPLPYAPPPLASSMPTPAPRRRPALRLTMWRAGITTPSTRWHQTRLALRKSRDHLSALERGGPPVRPRDVKPHKRSVLGQVKMQRQLVDDWQMRMFLTPNNPLAFSPDLRRRAEHMLDRMAQESRMHFRPQHKIPWDSDPGFCVGLSMEFLHWRNSGLSSASILPRLGRLDARARLRSGRDACATDAGHCSHQEAAWKIAQRAGKDAAATARAKRRYLDTRMSVWEGVAGTMHRELLNDHGFALQGGQWPFSLSACKRFHPEFSLESFCHYAPAAYRTDAGNLLLGLVKPDPGGLPVPQRQPEALDVEERWNHALLLQESWRKWVDTVKHLQVRKGPAHPLPFYVITFDTKRLDLDPHTIALDLTPECPGFFDPNFGFLPLDRHRPLNERFAWILALLIMYYTADLVEVYGMYPKPLHWDRAMPELDNIIKLRFLRGGVADPARVFARLPTNSLPFSSRASLPDPMRKED